jgi:hypothetical protein
MYTNEIVYSKCHEERDYSGKARISIIKKMLVPSLVCSLDTVVFNLIIHGHMMCVYHKSREKENISEIYLDGVENWRSCASIGPPSGLVLLADSETDKLFDLLHGLLEERVHAIPHF